MNLFASVREAREIGADLVRLHRTALGRNPDADGLAGLLAVHRAGTSLADIARILMRTSEFECAQRDAEPGVFADGSFASRVAIQALGTAGPIATALAGTLAGLDPEFMIVAAATAAPVKFRSALFPSLFPEVPPDDRVAYALWIEEHDTPSADALAQVPAPAGPRLSVLMLTGDTDAERALRTADSLRAQVYPCWELCLSRRLYSSWPRDMLDRVAAEEPRVRLLEWPAGGSRGEALNRALSAATGAFAGALEPGDTLDRAALLEIASALAAHPETLLVYTDEDEAEPDGRRASPWFKPQCSPDAMLAGNAIGRLALFDAGLLARLGGFRAATAPAEEYDLALRAAEAAGARRITHVPAILCHRADAPRDWPLPASAMPRGAADLDVVGDGAWPRVRPRLPDPAPLVTVIVPTKDRADLLAACTTGVLSGTDYPALDLLVVDNGSTEPSARALLAELAGDPRVRVIRHPGRFNFATMNNAAARAAHGSVLVLLNNDVEIIDPGWLREMAAHAVRPDIGLVGARLLYRDGTLQHGGMVLGPEGAATHLLRGAAPDDPGYGGQLACTRDVSAVTAACVAIRREVWQRVGGMNEELPVAWNDVDLCQRVRAHGLRILWTPFASLLHLEGATREIDAADPERQARFLADQARYHAIWGRAADEDPFLNPNLIATAHQLCLAPPRTPRAWQTAATAHG